MDAKKLSNSGCDLPLAFAVGRKAAPEYRTGSRPRNRLLAALPPEVLLSLLPHLKLTVLHRRNVLCDDDESLSRVYFIEAGLVFLVVASEGRTTAGVATVGREGLVGVGIVLGGERALGRYVAPMPGLALAVEASQFRSALRETPELRAACEAYAQAFLREALQTAACNSVHMVEERCARWLMMSYDRSDGNTFALTQGQFADILGVCRSTVTLAAGALQKAGLIRYQRGEITVLDRIGLEVASCECYRVVRNQYERLLPRPYERARLLVDEPHLSRAFG